MKSPVTLIITALLLVIAGCITGRHARTGGSVDITDVRQTHLPESDLANHKHHDVAVYRTMDTHEYYEVFCYRKEKDTLRCYQSLYGSDEDMDKAAYQWLNDSLVAVRIYNSVSGKEIKLRVSGHRSGSGTTTSMIIDE